MGMALFKQVKSYLTPIKNTGTEASVQHSKAPKLDKVGFLNIEIINIY